METHDAALLETLRKWDTPTICNGLEIVAPERRAIGQERLHRLEQALADLPPLPRAAFALQRRDGLSYAEIAERLNTTPHMVKKHISAALQRCRHVLSMDDDE